MIPTMSHEGTAQLGDRLAVEGFHYTKVKDRAGYHRFFVCAMGSCRRKYRYVGKMEEHVHRHFWEKKNRELWRDPLWRLTARVKDMWNLRKIHVRSAINDKAKLAYPVRPSPPDPGLTPPLIEILKQTVLPDMDMHVWDCLLDKRKCRQVKALLRKAAKSDLVGEWLHRLEPEIAKTHSDSGMQPSFADLHFKAAFDDLAPIAKQRFQDMDEAAKDILNKHADLALLWIHAKQNLLQWETSTELRGQKVASQTTYEIWKRDHKFNILQRIRDDFYEAHRKAFPFYSHDTTVEHVPVSFTEEFASLFCLSLIFSYLLRPYECKHTFSLSYDLYLCLAGRARARHP